MTREEVLRKIGELGLIAVVRGDSEDAVTKAVEALIAGGVLGIEITFTVKDAPLVLRRFRDRDDILLGAGTVLSLDQLRAAVESGAKFIVSPHTDPEIMNDAARRRLAVVPGALTPTEVVTAWRLGAEVIKIFPGSLCGPAYLSALRGPLPMVKYMPTGGVNLENLGDWFKAGAYAVGVGGELVARSLISQGRYSEITNIARSFVEKLKRVRNQ